MINILIPTDFSENSFIAVDFVYSNFDHSQLNVRIVHAISQPVSTSGVMLRLDDLMRQDAERDMALFLEKIEDIHSVKPESIIKYGHLKDVVDGISNLVLPDLLVMGTKGENNIKSRIMGSVAEAIIRTSRTPVLAVPVDWFRDKIDRVTIATDKSEIASSQFLRKILRALKLTCPKLELLTVQKPNSTGKLPKSLSFEGFQFDVVGVENEVVVDGINDYLGNSNVGMLILYHGHNSRFDYLFNRSVTKTICANVEVPLLVIPSVR